ncbi:MAG: MBL fold metallo-hydrolase [Pseudomonadota bacterium]
MHTDSSANTTRRRNALLAAIAACALVCGDGWAATDFNPAKPAPGNLRFAWIHGSISAMHNTDPRIQIHRYNEHSYILRQNPAVHWEAPFMYLLFGAERVLLIDTGATEELEYFPLRNVVDAVIARWTTAQQHDTEPELVILTTGDAPAQTAGLGQFTGRPNTRIATATPGGLPKLSLLNAQSETEGTLDLGGRIIHVLATPGTSATGISLYDPYTDFLFTGTTMLPGRIVIRDYDAYFNSVTRLSRFTEEMPVAALMGGQIDMSSEPGVDYRLRSNFRPNERGLTLPVAALKECLSVVHLINGREAVEVLPDFIVMNGVGRGYRPYGFPMYQPDFTRQRRLR